MFLIDTLWNNCTLVNTSPALESNWHVTSLSTLSWLNVLLSLRQTLLPDCSSGLSFNNSNIIAPTVVSVDSQAIPKYGGFIRVMFLAAALIGVKDVKVMEKKKEQSFVMVRMKFKHFV